ncbi:MAG: phosphoenolpyruvate--protein phosphotransferase, partial [Gemmatimonadaceae bacterium]
GLPGLVGLRTATDELVVGQRVILDGSAGVIVVNPSDEDVRYWQERARREAEEEEELRGLSAAEAITLDGVRVTIRANVDLPEEA